MKALFAAAIILASAASLLAQGQIVTGSMSVEAVIFAQNSGLVSERELPLSSTTTLSDWLPPSQRSSTSSDDVLLIESSRQTTLIDTPVTPLLPPTPLTDSALTSQSSFAVEPVPEPSAFALGGLALGLIAIKTYRSVFAALI